MKSNKIISKNIIIIFVLAAVLMFVTGCCELRTLSKKEYVSKELGINIRKGIVEKSLVERSDFLGDGITFVKIVFDDDSCLEEIKDNEDWCSLPLTKNLTEFLDSVNYDEDDSCIVPDVKNGYYCFIDRHSESKDRKDDTDLLNRFSINATLAIYDTDTNILYYAEEDT